MDVVFAHADRIIVLARGQLIAEGAPAAVRDDPRRARGLLSAAAQSRRTSTRCSSVTRALDAWYGQAQILYGVSLERRRRRVRRAARPQRRRQVDDDEGDHGPGARRRGRVASRGRDIDARCRPIASRRLGLGWVPEDRRIFTDLTVRENLAVGRQPPRDGAPTWTEDELFALFPNLAAMPDRPGGRMSGGEQQMLTVARTLMGNPHLRAARRAVGRAWRR